MANVAVGRAYTTQEGELPSNMCPPEGFDSVIGQVRAPPRVSSALAGGCAVWTAEQ